MKLSENSQALVLDCLQHHHFTISRHSGNGFRSIEQECLGHANFDLLAHASRPSPIRSGWMDGWMDDAVEM